MSGNKIAVGFYFPLRALFFIVVMLSPFSLAAEDGKWQALLEVNTRLAEKGSAKAQYSLGGMYEEGRGVEVNFAKAHEWYLKAADQGHAGASNRLGNFYEEGRGVAVDKAKAIEWYQKGAAKGDFEARLHLKRLQSADNEAKKREEITADEAREKVIQAERAKQRAEQERARKAADEKKRAERERARKAAIEKQRAEQEQRRRAQAEARAKQKAIAEERARRAAQEKQREEARQQAESVEKQQRKAGKSDKDSFETDPCKTPAARYLSTCR